MWISSKQLNMHTSFLVERKRLGMQILELGQIEDSWVWKGSPGKNI